MRQLKKYTEQIVSGQDPPPTAQAAIKVLPKRTEIAASGEGGGVAADHRDCLAAFGARPGR